MATKMTRKVRNKMSEIRRHGTLQGRRVSMDNPEDRQQIIAAAYNKARREGGKRKGY